MAKSSKIVEAQAKKEKQVIDIPETIEYKSRAPRKQKTLFSQIRNIEDGKKETIFLKNVEQILQQNKTKADKTLENFY